MALFFGNASGVTAFVAIIFHNPDCGPFSPFRKSGWFQVDNGEVRNLWPIDLQTVKPGAFFAEQFLNGQGLTWGDLGVNNEVFIRPGYFNLCFDSLSGCTQRAKFGLLAFNTPNTLISLLPHVPGQPPWREFRF
jgi:hypothetical protein